MLVVVLAFCVFLALWRWCGVGGAVIYYLLLGILVKIALTWKRGRQKTAITSFVVLTAVLLYGLTDDPFLGRVSYGEFSSETFQLRGTSYYALFGIPVTSKRTTMRTTPLAEYLRDNGYVPQSQDASENWYFIRGRAPDLKGWRGGSIVGCWVLTTGDDEWVEWSQKNPELAQRLWPKVVTAARSGRFEVIRYLFAFDHEYYSQDVDEFDKRLAEIHRLVYLRLGASEEVAGDDVAASDVYSELLTLDPECVDAYRRRARVYVRLGRTDLATEDRRKVSALKKPTQKE